MDKRIIISIGREFGSGGHLIGEAIAEHYGIPLYDKNILESLARKLDVNADALKEASDMPVSRIHRRIRKGLTSSFQENIANLEFDYLKEKAESGESFVIIGRCADQVLKNYTGIISIFVMGTNSVKRDRIINEYDIPASEADKLMRKVDANRRSYYNYFFDAEWGNAHNYDICINSDLLGVSGTAEMLIDVIDKYIEMQ